MDNLDNSVLYFRCHFIIARQAQTTPKQIRLLERYGFLHVGEWDFNDASRMISRISAAGWRVPRGIDPAMYKPAGKKEALSWTDMIS